MNRGILAPTTLFQGRYEILSGPQETALAAVYHGRRIASGQPVVLEVVRILPEGISDELARRRRARFLREMNRHARLRHPGIARIVDAGQTDDGQLYAVFERVPGQSLAELLAAQGALCPREARRLMRQVLDALAFAHRQGMIHGDVRPAHVMVSSRAERSALLFGFGSVAAVARVAGGGAHVPGTGIVGSLSYAAPEQRRGFPPTARADLYAWGLVFLECLTGRRPGCRVCSDGDALVHAERGEAARIPRALLDHPLGVILRRATIEDVAARDVTADGLLTALDACDVDGLRREDLIRKDAPGSAEAERRADAAGAAPAASGRAAALRRDDAGARELSIDEPARSFVLTEVPTRPVSSVRARGAAGPGTGDAGAAAEPAPGRVPPKAGDVIKHYEIIRRLGQGGMGVVYLARDTKLGRCIALKLLVSYTGQRVERFLDEARATARCRHENIVVIHEVDEIHGCPYLVLEYIKGRSLREWMTQREQAGAPGPPAPRTPPGPRMASAVVEIMIPVLRALVCAHGLGIVHRDLKPENIRIDDAGCIKVLDFGLAKRIGASVDSSISSARAALAERVGRQPMSTISGTPGYMAPEQLLGMEIDGRTDLWAVGILLYELLTGDHPLRPFSLARLPEIMNLELPMPSLSERRPELGALGALVDRCLKKHKAERVGSASELLAGLEALAPGRRALRMGEDESPFAGLSAFQEEDAGRFFGRDREITAVATRLRSEQLLVVAGPSGAGKSSFVRAGVIPALKGAGDCWEAFVLRPGRRPLSALADVLVQVTEAERASGAAEGTAGTAGAAEGDASACSTGLADHEALVATLRAQPGYLGVRLRARCRREGTARRILLFVDQFEELFTLGAPPEERAAFIACLEGAADDASSPVRVLLAVRSDFIERMADDQGFIGDVTRGLWFLPPMGRAGLREALMAPLEAAGYRFETERTVGHMLGTLEGTRNPLPLLQFTAMKLWEARDREGRLLTEASYERLGGVAGALSAHADAVISMLPSSEQRLARKVFQRLVTPERTRAVVSLDELRDAAHDGEGSAGDAVAQVIVRLAGARLLLIEAGDDEPGGARDRARVELVHESLIDRWPRLGQWLAECEQDAQFRARLRVAAQQWEASGQAAGLLWRDRAAEDAMAWCERRRAERGAGWRAGLGSREERYLSAIVALHDRARRLRRRITLGAVAALCAVALVVSGLAIRAGQQAARAGQQAARADQEAAHAQVEAREARNATRMATAREMYADPTTVLALLREAEPPDVPRGWAVMARSALASGVARAVLSHPDLVMHADYSPDGRRIVTACADGTALVWNSDGSGEPIVLRGHRDRVSSAAFSPDGKRIVTASWDNTVRVWNADGSGEPLIFRSHERGLFSAAFSPDGERIVTASWDKTARVWNADGSGEPLILRGHEGEIYSAAFSPDGKRIATASWDGTARIWNADGTGKPVVLRGHGSGLASATFSPDGQRVVTASHDKTARVWNADGSGEPLILRGHEEALYAATFSPDGKRIVTASWDRTARVWNADGSGEPTVLGGHEDGIHSASFSPDSKRVVTASYDKTARVWDIHDTIDPRPLRGHDDIVYSAAFSPDGKRIVTASWDKTARVWNADGSSEPLVLRGHQRGLFSAAFSPDGKRIVTAASDKTARVWNADGTGEPVVLRGHEGALYSAAFSPDGKRVVTASYDKTVRVWNADGTGEPVLLRGHENEVFSAEFSPDGTRIVTASRDRTARVWSADGIGEPVVLRGHSLWVRSASFSPDGERIVTASFDRTARVWNADGSGEPMVLKGHEHWLWRAAFSPDGKRIVTASQDKTARVWNADGTGEPLVLRASDSPVNGAAFSPDGERVVTASDDKIVRVWSDLEPLRGIDDPKLWAATSYCMPVERRIDLLRVPEPMARANREACLRRVELARAAAPDTRPDSAAPAATAADR
ncbi:nSTAND1 domain-containing NTPase [Sorangium sp. So ce1024]|uniref:WD40 repeat domain-containing serine/threonine protein kinase n=1 Tax=Sorangium sp. So ce1024 TaxID=3133327 RepID=UPI003F007854